MLCLLMREYQSSSLSSPLDYFEQKRKLEGKALEAQRVKEVEYGEVDLLNQRGS